MLKNKWERRRLGELATLQRGFDLPTARRTPGKVPVISSGGQTGWHNESKVNAPGVVTGRYGSIGDVHYVVDPFWPLNTTLFVKDFHGNDPKYVFYLLQRLDFRSFSDKTGVPGVNRNDLHQIRVPAPPLPEQKKIAEILSTWDAAIDQTRRLIDAKKRCKKGLMQQLLFEKKRLPGCKKVWKEYLLGDLFEERKETNGADLPLLAITGGRGVILSSEINRKDSSSNDKSRYKKILPGDIGYNTMRMWQGVSAVSSLEGIVSPAYTICIPKQTVDVQFMGYFFKFPPVINLFWRYSQGLVADTLNLKFHNFALIKVTIPDIDEQRAIAAVLQTADDEINQLEAKLRALEKQKRGLMQKLLTGEIRVAA